MLLLVICSMFALQLDLSTMLMISAVLMLLVLMESAEEPDQPDKSAARAPHASPRRR